MNFNILNTSANSFDSGAVATPLGTTDTLFTIPLNGMPFVTSAEILNLGANAFDAFLIEAQAVEGGAWFTYISGTQITTATAIAGLLRVSTGAPVTLASLGSAFLCFEGAALNAIRFRASNATAIGSGQVRGFNTLIA